MILDLSGYDSPIDNIDDINMYSPIQQLWDPTIIGWEKIGSEIIVKFAVFMYTGWRRPIGCLELQVIFCKRATNYRALLRKMTYEDKASYASTPPCTINWE